MSRPEIRLRVIREHDAFIVVDQDGRKVAGTKKVCVEAPRNGVVLVSLTFMDTAEKTGRPHPNIYRPAED